MTLGEKLRYLREVEGALRGLDRPLTQMEVVNELGGKMSQSYLSQVENGRRKHLTESTRAVLSKFFNVHPGYLVTDPDGYQEELATPIRASEDSLDLWLISGAEQFSRDPAVSAALLAVARNDDSRKCLMLLKGILDMPGLSDRLLEVLGPEQGSGSKKARRL